MKKFLSLILALAMVMSVMSFSVFAEDFVAEVNGVGYTTFQGAIDAAEDGDVVTLLNDLEQAEGILIENKNITVDLGGYTFAVTEGANVNSRNFKVTGTSDVIIQNGIIISKGDITSGAYGSLRTEGTATVLMKGLKTYSYRGYGLNVKACAGTTITIEDTEIYAQYSGGVEAAGGTIILNKGTKIEQTGIYSGAAWCSVAIGVNGGGKVVVNDGFYSAKAIETDANAAQGTWVAYVMSSGGILEINGGEFVGVVSETAAPANACGIICADTKAVVEIKGGNFESNGAIFDVRNNEGLYPNPSVTLIAGSFSSDPSVSGLYGSNLIKVDENSDLAANSDGTFTVKAPVAETNGKYYTSLQAAIDAAVSGDTIYIINEVNEGSIKLPATISDLTIDGQGTAVVKNTVITAADGNSVNYQGLTIKNTTFDNSRFVLGGMRSGNVIYKDLVFDNNIFQNIVADQSMAAVHMNIASEDNEYVENFTFTNNVIDGVTGSSNSGVLIKNAKGNVVFENNIISNVVNNAIQCINPKSDINLVISNNTLSSNLGNVINLFNVTSATIENNTITLNEGQSAFGYFKAVANIGNTSYTDVQGAIAAAQDGDTIDLLGKTVVIDVYQDSYHQGKSLTFKNGTLDFSYAGAPTALFWLTGNQKLAFEDVNIIKRDVGTERKFMYNLIQIASPTASVSFKDCTIDLDGGYDKTNKVGMYSSYIANDGNGTMYFENCDIETEYTNFIYRGGATVINCTYNGFADLDDGDTAGNFILWSANPCVIKNSTINTRQLGFISANGSIAITENSYVYAERVRHYYAADSADYTEGLLTVDATSTLEAIELDMGLINDASEGVITSEASSVYVQYKKVDVDENGNDTDEDSDKYEIVLAGANNSASEEIINELASADLTFEFVGTPVTGGEMAYFVAPAEGVSLTQLGERYMFNYDGVTKYEESGKAIVIGTITIEGYGSYTLGTKDVATNAVYATEIRDNIVDGFTPAAGLVTNLDLIKDDGMVGKIVGADIAVPVRTLTINIDFPNEVKDQVALYQDMKVEITGNIDGVNQTATYDLGGNMINGSYVVTENRLVLNNAYTVTVSGAGYRTARYTVTMTDNKILKFWNNVMDEAQFVEIGKDSSKVNVTFLAGDIVKDNKINIYDLSAVVSYFGTVTKTEVKDAYAKYDLNRDGVIDSKDVAYVLVSWNN